MRVVAVLAVLLLAGCGAPSFLVTPVANSNKLVEDEVEPGSGWATDKIAIVEVEGVLANARAGGLLQATENSLSRFTQEMKRAEDDKSVKAVVLRVNSPGGTVSAADAMYQIVCRFKQKTGKPVVASVQEVGASGAYYVSCAADRIVAQPTSLVGSIGVIVSTFDIEGTLDKLGIRSQPVKSGTLKDMGSPLKAMQPNEREIEQQIVDEYFRRFIGIVRRNRPVKEEPLATLEDYNKPPYAGVFSGRVYSGDRAKDLGLVDETGLLDDAISAARGLGKAPHAKVVMYRRPYGYGGSIYATASIPAPQANVTHLELPGADWFVPTGFYYLWRMGS